MKANLFWSLTLLTLFSLPVSSIGAEATNPLFQKIQVPADKIPAECKVEEIPPEQIQGKFTNPGSTSDPVFIKNATQDDSINISQVKNMFFAVYKVGDLRTGASEAGIFVWEFDSPEHAKQSLEKFLTKPANKGSNVKTWLRDNNLIVVWRDSSGAEKCFTVFNTHVESVVGKN